MIPRRFKTAKVSEGQQQWWQFKSTHFDSVLLFKMGKFYEVRRGGQREEKLRHAALVPHPVLKAVAATLAHNAGALTLVRGRLQLLLLQLPVTDGAMLRCAACVCACRCLRWTRTWAWTCWASRS